MTLDTRDDRTLFFDLLPMFFRMDERGRAAGFSFRIKVYTVPGQPVHEATRRVVLTGADGVVFVADSRPDHADANRQAWANLVANLRELQLDHAPVIVQYNKRDLPEAVPLADVDRFGDPARPIFEACARGGGGVAATFFELIERTWDALDRDLKLADKLGLDAGAFRRAVAEHVGAMP
jgi:hypothetical protein